MSPPFTMRDIVTPWINLTIGWWIRIEKRDIVLKMVASILVYVKEVLVNVVRENGYSFEATPAQ